jgi:hypothetical protein
MLAHNIAQRSVPELREPLEEEQVAPFLYLAATRKCLELFGRSERALRLPSLLAGLLLLPLAAAFFRESLPRGPALAAMGLLAVSDPLVDYAVQVKPYALDAAVALLVLLLAWRELRDAGRWWARLILAAVGFLGPWLSFPLAFVLPVAWGLLAWARLRRRAALPWSYLLGVAALWAVSALGFLIHLQGWSDRVALRSVWERTGGFPPLPPKSLAELVWYVRAAVKVPMMPGGVGIPGLGALLALGGLVVGWRRGHRPLVILLVGPLLAALVAAAVRAYPFSGRLLLFAAPGLAGLMALGTHPLWGARGWRRGLLALLLVASVGTEAGRAVARVVAPKVREDVRSAVTVLRREARPGDLVYVYYGAVPTFRWYAPDPPWRVHEGTKARRAPERYAEEVAALPAADRVWFLFSHLYTWGGTDEEAVILEAAGRRGKRLAGYRLRGTRLYLYRWGGGT